MNERSVNWTDAAHPFWTWAQVICAAATVVPLWSAAHLPFTDLPQHVAAIGALRHWWDPAWKSRQYYTFTVGGSQYVLYYLSGALLAFPFATAERANVVLLSLIAVAFPYSLRSLLRAIEVDARLALFACALFWSQPLLIGYFNYIAAMPVLLWGLARVVRQAEAPSHRTFWLLAATGVALFYLHLSALLFFVLAGGIAALALPLPRVARPRAWWLRLLWMVPAGLLTVFWLSKAHVTPLAGQGAARVRFEAPSAALRNVPEVLINIWRGPEGEWCLFALIGAAALLATLGAVSPGVPRRNVVVAAWVLLAGVLYFAFPFSIGVPVQLNERYALVFALLVPALLRPGPGMRGALPLLLVAATGLGAAGVALVNIRHFDREVGGFDAVLAHAAPGRRVIGVIVDQNSGVAKFSPFLHFASYYRARQGGVASFSFAEYPFMPLQYKQASAPPRKPIGWEWDSHAFNNAIDGAYYDYVLVHGDVDPFARQSPGPRWHLLSRDERWALYEKIE